MIHSVRFTAVLDTNVIYPVIIRDLLFWFAYAELYTPKWSAHIFAEWQRVMERKGVDADEIRKRTNVPNKAFPMHWSRTTKHCWKNYPCLTLVIAMY